MMIKRLFISLLMAVCLVAFAEARTFVLATGVSNYGDANNNLTQTTKDAKRFKELMETQTKDITLLTSSNVTRANLLEKLRAICNRAQKGDRVIFFFSGHGMQGAICAYDQPVSYSDIISVLNSSAASEKICFIDACHAGTMASKSADDSWGANLKGAKDQAFFVSCRPEEISKESPALGAGYFTQALLKGMRGKADKDADKKITVMELFKYIYGDVVKRSDSRQHPQLIAPETMHDRVLTVWN